ncbi:hypothetical protein SDC9_106666 [bioreactor metagenome]|uniref:Aminoglycoside phosphotransferase domain-containing protein n=1 Tax=bioreactor metagenome TaxID=1076179 RepID=A0A645B2Y7_9ZZZZ|nr:aminoglycoside phosphotransferase family protein [Oscillospiraceae bacterium]
MKLDNIIAVRPTKTVYRDGDKCIKVFNEESASSVLRQALNLSIVAESGIHAPKFIEVVKTDGKWALVSEFIEGKTIEQLIRENPGKYEEYMDRFVDIQLEMHMAAAAGLNKLKDKMHRKIRESGLDATARYELHTRLDSIEEHKKLCHGDYNPSNVIITDKDEAYIIDWAHATQGNASADAARTYLLFRLSGDIKSAELYMKLFCIKSDTAKQYVEKWLSIVAASQLGKNKSEQREFLIHWANIADYE